MQRGSPRIGRCAQVLAKDTNAFLVLAQGRVTLPAESAERHHLTMSAFVQLIQRQPTARAAQRIIQIPVGSQ